MTKLNKKSKQQSVDVASLVPTDYRFKLELNHNYSIEISREQYNEFKGRHLAKDLKEKLVPNIAKPGKYHLTVLRIADYLYNKITAYKTYTGIVLKVFKEYQSIIIDWRYRSCLAILAGRL